MKLGKLRITGVLRHAWEPGSECITENYTAYQFRKEWKLGIWIKRHQVVGPVCKSKSQTDTIKNTFAKNNLRTLYMFGINLIVCTAWIEISPPTFGN
jgi:hypothetical protein